MTPASVDAGKLFELVWSAAVAGIAVSLAFAILIVGMTRADDMRRAERPVAATAYLTLAILALVTFVGSVTFGVSVIVSK